MAQAPQRLKRRREFLHVARAGRKWAEPGLVLQVLDRQSKTHPISNSDAAERSMERQKSSAGDTTDESGIRVGFTVTRKVGGAVIRNRAKRRLRAAVETVMPTHAAPGRDYVVIGRAKTNARPFSDLIGDLEQAMRKLNAWRDIVTPDVTPNVTPDGGAECDIQYDTKCGTKYGTEYGKGLRNG